MTLKTITDFLKDNLSEKRFLHSVGVAQTAQKLAGIYSADIEKAYLAGLIHDCFKEKALQEMLDVIGRNNGIVDDIAKKSPALLHGVAGAYFAKENFTPDEDIFDAIYFHTFGKANMNLLTKIVFIADYIEPNRNFYGVEEVRNLAFTDINKAIIKACGNVIIHTVNKGLVIHPNTVEARNYLLKNNGDAANERLYT